MEDGQSYPVVDIRRSINDLGPEEALAKRVAHGLALPITTRSTSRPGKNGFMGLNALFFKNGVRSRLQLPD